MTPSRRALVLGALLLAVLTGRALPFELFPFPSGPDTLYLKWGDSNAEGTPGGLVRWSLMPAGTPGSAAYCDSACPGTSVDSIPVEIAPGAGFQPQTLQSLQPVIAEALAHWARVTGIEFEYLGIDDGHAVNTVDAVPPATGEIRIGAFPFTGGGAAVG